MAELSHLRARQYDPATGRFTSPDPLGYGGGENLYAYAANSPTNNVDPSGLYWETALDLAFIGYDLHQLVTGGAANRRANLIALGLDVAGAALPLATGLGAAYRAGRLAGNADDGVSLYRAIGEDELSDVLRFGDYGLSPHQGGKYFSLTEEGARRYAGGGINAGARMTITEIHVPRSFLQRGFRFNDSGGAGRAIHFADDVLPDLYRAAGLPRIIDASWVPTLR